MKYQEFKGWFHVSAFLKIIEFTQHSAGLSLGNLVDGLPGALHTEAFWGDRGVFGPAPKLWKKTDLKYLET